MRNRLFGWMIAIAAVAAVPTVAVAQQEREWKGVDARLDGYSSNVTQDVGTAKAWFALAGLGVVALGVLFKDARRTHLD